MFFQFFLHLVQFLEKKTLIAVPRNFINKFHFFFEELSNMMKKCRTHKSFANPDLYELFVVKSLKGLSVEFIIHTY